MKGKFWDGESLLCTAPWCRQTVLAGAAIQYVDDKDRLQRVCWKCWQKMEKAREDAYDRSRADVRPQDPA